jgi:hypothetical protein
MSQNPHQPLNAFSPEYLAALRERDEPPSASDADSVGPWRYRERDGRFYIFRQWESFETGHRPVAAFQSREDALLFMTALRVAAGMPVFRVRNPESPAAEGYEVEREGEVVGHLKSGRPELVTVANVLAATAHSPVDLAILLEMSGSQVQEMAGEILGQDILGGPGTGAGGSAET